METVLEDRELDEAVCLPRGSPHRLPKSPNSSMLNETRDETPIVDQTDDIYIYIYLKSCACMHDHLQAPKDIQEIISRMSWESGKALKELAWRVETMTKPCSRPESHESSRLRVASKNLQSLDLWEEQTMNVMAVMPVAAVASLLNDTVGCVEEIADAIDELSSLANFKQEEKMDASLFSVVIDDGGDGVKLPSKSSVAEFDGE